MTLELVEAAVDALSTLLQDAVSAKVIELNARYGDDIALVNPLAWYVGGYPMAMPEQPSVALVAISWMPLTERRANIDGETRIDIAVFVGGNELEDRYRRLCRYAIGVIEMVKAGEHSSGYKINIAGPVALTDVMDTPSFLQAVIVPVTAGKTEEY